MTAEQLREAVERVLADSCHHCGRLPEEDGDHSCPCPKADSECFEHTLHPVASREAIRAILGGAA